MFARRAVAEKPVSVVPPPVRPKPRAVVANTFELGTYEALAAELNFQPGQLLEEQLRRFMAEEGMETYKLSDVDAYLAPIAEKEGKVWIWRPLRPQDKPNGWGWEGRRDSKNSVHETRGHGSYKGNEWEFRPYDKAVPIHALRKVKKIQDKFGPKLLFFVSDYAVPNPDPFIMTTALGVSKIVFDVWDEPGFGA